MSERNECLVCGAPLEYLSADEQMECAFCHEKKPSRARCRKGHFICDDCHTSGIDTVIAVCLASASKNPIAILEELMSQSFCHMHGPEHHVLVGAALLTAYHNAGGELDLAAALMEMIARGRQIPGGTCGFWGACGAGISTGIFVAIVTESNPLAVGSWGLSNRMTGAALARIGEIGGPRCCKRDSYLAVLSAVDFSREHLGVEMERSHIHCQRDKLNAQCIQGRCPFSVRQRSLEISTPQP